MQDVALLAGISAMPTFQIWRDNAKQEEIVGAAVEKLEVKCMRWARVCMATPRAVFCYRLHCATVGRHLLAPSLFGALGARPLLP